MAEAKPTPKALKCKISDIAADPLHPGRMIISVKFDDGQGEPWHQGFSVIPDQVVTIDDFLAQLYTQDIKRPVDPYSDLKRVMQKGETFVLNLTAKIESGAQN